METWECPDCGLEWQEEYGTRYIVCPYCFQQWDSLNEEKDFNHDIEESLDF